MKMTSTNQTIFQGLNDDQDVLLRGIILFNLKEARQNRKDLMTKAIFSIIVAGRNQVTRSDILNTLNQNFNQRWSDSDLDVHIKKLKQLNLIEINENNKVIVLADENNPSFYSIISETNSFIDRIIDLVRQIYKGNLPSDIDVRNAVEKALSSYLYKGAYEMFAIKRKSDVNETINAIEVIKTQIPNKRLQESIIRALSSILSNPTELDKHVLEMWARAHISMQLIGLDPVLRNFKATKLRDKSFVIDTDVVLNCLTKHAKRSQLYRDMISNLKDFGCKLYLPENVIQEVKDHCDMAIGKYKKYGGNLFHMPDSDLEQGGAANVFIESYIKGLRANGENIDDYPFNDFIRNIYDSDYPQLLEKNLSAIFGEKNMNYKLPELKEEDLAKIETIFPEIHSRTLKTPKAENRTEEGNVAISYADAINYYTVYKMNDDNSDTDFFSKKAYLLTSSKRALDSAKAIGDENKYIVCHPEALISIFGESGSIKSVPFINLFENPFLVHTAQTTMRIVDTIIRVGGVLKNKDYLRLELDVDLNIDKLLTSNNIDERVEEAKRLKDRGYLFVDDLVKKQEEIDNLKEENDNLKKQLAEVQARVTEKEKNRKKEKFYEKIKNSLSKKKKK